MRKKRRGCLSFCFFCFCFKNRFLRSVSSYGGGNADGYSMHHKAVQRRETASQGPNRQRRNERRKLGHFLFLFVLSWTLNSQQKDATVTQERSQNCRNHKDQVQPLRRWRLLLMWLASESEAGNVLRPRLYSTWSSISVVGTNQYSRLLLL